MTPHTPTSELELIAELSTCNYASCRIFEECIERYDDDEAPPCAKYQTKEHNQRIASEAREKVLKPLKAVHEKFDHLDKCLSDTEWCKAGEGGAIYGIAGEMWRAIKESLRQQGGP